MLLTIPLEIRQAIYRSLFQSTTVRHGFEGTIPSQHTSLLRTCRQINIEAKEYLAPNIGLHFFSTASMLDCLTVLSRELITKVRFVRVTGYPFPVYVQNYYYTTYNMSSVLPLFSGLQLDVFTVEDPYHPGDGFGDVGTYYEIESLLESTGWKELRYISPSSDFISSSRDHHQVRVAQPEGWNKLHREPKNELAVTMYIANEPEVKGMAENPDTRSKFSGIPSHLRLSDKVNPSEDVSHDDREVLVVARRGDTALYIQDGSSFDKDLKKLFSSTTWQELKGSHKYVPPEDDPTAHL